MALAIIHTGQDPTQLVDFAVLKNTLFVLNGVDRNGAYSGDVYRWMGIDAPGTLRTGFTIAGAATSGETTVVIDADANETDDYYIGGIITIGDDSFLITDYVAATNTVTVDTVWSSTHAAGTAYTIIEKCKLTESTGGSLDAGDHNIKITFYDQTHDLESNASAVVTIENVTVNGTIIVSNLPKPRQANVTHWRIYRSGPNQTTYYRDDTVAIGTWDGTETTTLTDVEATLAAKTAYSNNNNTFLTSNFIESGKERVFLAGKFYYNASTASVVNGSKTVIGEDTEWTEAMVGLDITFGDNYYAYEIASVEGNQKLTLTAEYSEATVEKGAYAIIGNNDIITYCTKDGSTVLPESINRTNNWIGAEAGDNDKIVGLRRVGDDDIMIIKTEHIYRLQGRGADDFYAPGLVADVGAAGNWCIEIVDGKLFLQTPDSGCKTITVDGTQANVSEPVSTWFSPSNIEESRNKYNYAKFYNRKRQLWLSYTTADGTKHDKVAIYEPDTNSWYRFTNMNINAMEEVVDSDGKKQLYWGDTLGFVYKADDGDYDGESTGTLRGVVTSVSTTSSTSTSTSSTSSTTSSTSTTTTSTST